ncbi:glycoside hydrolase family 31 protein [Sinimarinibacterium sp. CAU 1509]|uniref:glycoside hydrolase family 31 protein n=1 Tax=Sinimarinibacterium sp. CAU 1509 TaxID=2562283 RepID=UPI0010ABB564|nr:TIM-barrel domain-containing protein [Sinimarinibacterium sp. CAU 1509]TJY59511.1 glycoside hydrolase family 31 protein [Sinimarinibacterium sp. CAU 1509]
MPCVYPAAAAIAAVFLLSACGATSVPTNGTGAGETSSGLSLDQNAERFSIGDGHSSVELNRNPLSLRWLTVDGTVVLQSAAAAADPSSNDDYDSNNDKQDGIDQAYPGLPDISYAAFGYRTGDGWQRATTAESVQLSGDTATVALRTGDGAGAQLALRFADDGALELRFTPQAAEVQATEIAWSSPGDQHYFGGGQRFSGIDMRGTSLPLWISHGPKSNRETSTNEIAASFFWCPCGWGAWGPSDARGEINFANPDERDDAVNLMQEAASMEVVLYRGTPQQMVSTHTARAGRPQWTPPDWMFRPMVWQDSDTSTETVRALLYGMLDRDIPLGAVWLDNPWDAGKGSFDFDPGRFEDADALIDEVHAQGVRLMVWLSPFMSGAYESDAAERGWLVTGTRADGNDATYYPTRGIDPHLDFTNPDAYAWWRDGLRALIRRGIDGVKVDRGEEDLSDDSVWNNGLHNRLNHNAYVGRYHRAIYEAFRAERGDDFAIFARGGWNGSAQWSGHWAADNGSFFGELGLTQALRSLLSLSVSGFVFNGADIGGYAGLRQDAGESVGGIPLLPPGTNLFIRWTQLGALSPIMQTDVPPWWVSDRAVRVYRTYATLHDRLVPYIARHARASIETGVPIVRPMAYAFPDEPMALNAENQYLFGPDLLVAPLTDALSGLEVFPRTVFIPPGRWTSFWTGQTVEGPTRIAILAPLEQIPLYVREGAVLPDGVSAAALP